MMPDAPERSPADGPTPSDPNLGRRSGSEAPDPRMAAREARRAARDLFRHIGVLIAAAGHRLAAFGRDAAARSATLLARRRNRGRTQGVATVRPATAAGASVNSRRTVPMLGRVGRRPILLAAGAVILLPVLALAIYLLAALLTLPPLGGAVVDTGQRAITVESDDGRVFATRGASAARSSRRPTFRRISPRPSWRSRTGASTATGASTCAG